MADAFQGLADSDFPALLHGKIPAEEPPALRKLGFDSAHWTMKVKGIGSGYFGTVEELMQKAKAGVSSRCCCCC